MSLRPPRVQSKILSGRCGGGSWGETRHGTRHSGALLLIPALTQEAQAGGSGFQASLVYRVCSRTGSKVIQRISVSMLPTKKGETNGNTCLIGLYLEIPIEHSHSTIKAVNWIHLLITLRRHNISATKGTCYIP